MPTFIYSPGIKVYIDTIKSGIVDVSDDIVDFTMQRRSDGVSSFNFSLQNKRRQYDNLFTPNDRIIVMMKRISWLRTFTGYLNDVPIFSVWPRVIPMSSSCTLKRLQYWYWDSTLQASQQLVLNHLTAAGVRAEVKAPDGGIKNAAMALLDKVVGWPPEKVHIAQIPNAWFQWATAIAKEVVADLANAQAFAAQVSGQLGAQPTMGGVTGGTLTAGDFGGRKLTQEQVDAAAAIINTTFSLGFGDKEAIIAVATASQESSLRNLSGGDRDSVGLFQQRPSQAWGTVEQCRNPVFATESFLKGRGTNPGLTSIPNYATLPVTVAAQRVQRSAHPTLYADDEPVAVALVAAYKTSAPTVSPGTNPGPLGPAQAGGYPTSSALLQTAIDLLKNNPPIPYVWGAGHSPSAWRTNNPTGLDCSGFTMWCVAHATGRDPGQFNTTSAGMAGVCQSAGTLRKDVEVGLKTAGAIMFRSTNGAATGVKHVEISMGNGSQTIGTRKTGTPASIVTSTKWTHWGMAPGISYDGTVGASSGPVESGTLGGVDFSGAGSDINDSIVASTTGSDTPEDSEFEIDRLFNAQAWIPALGLSEAANASETFGGVLALINDEPILPYIANLMNISMRSFCSAPNGDFMAWFPDYYGIWGTAAKMVVKSIELQDFTVMWSDTSFITHQYVTADYVSNIDIPSGTVSSEQAIPAVTTHGVASIDFPSIMSALFGIEPTTEDGKLFSSFIYERFGARPNYYQAQGIFGPKGEFFMALFLFMRQWAYQYNADVPVTFMPEAWPGMLLQLPEFNFQAYITAVTHTGRFGPGGGFDTSINIASPANLDKSAGGNLLGLPLAGRYKPVKKGPDANRFGAVQDPTTMSNPAIGPLTGGFSAAASGAQ